MNAKTSETTITCPKCGATFSCTPGDCWCMALPAVLPLRYETSCYCPKCLGAIIEETTKKIDRLI